YPVSPQWGGPGVPPEREYFGDLKAVLGDAGGETAWHEFLKCMDLYSQEVLTRQEMLQLVGELFGAATDSFRTFQKLLDRRDEPSIAGVVGGGGYGVGAAASVGGGGGGGGGEARTEVWFATPLAEIDFSQCRRCTPSYRQMPRDFPLAHCGERTAADVAVLNDMWVSVPVGAESENTFKHGKKNQYEEVLFKCEDERFEFDMLIDANASTIHVLTPLAKEVEALQAQETSGRFQFKLDKRTFSTVHLNAMSRIYGSHAPELLELLRKNPAGTIPRVLQRLRQKDREWRNARKDLNVQWKSIQKKNYLKSLDRASFFFKAEDKKTFSTRALTAEIKERFHHQRDAEDRNARANEATERARAAILSVEEARETVAAGAGADVDE
ncbi:unnamed protein product, partial [Phaeothamnion confervicola]